ncbi:MAG: GlxA family transcriptional regulator [Pseudomonadota bacterium]
MTSISAKQLSTEKSPLSVLFIIYPDIVLLDLAGPLQVFAGATRTRTGKLAYKTAIASLNGGPIQTDTIVSIESEPMASWRNKNIDILVIVGGNGASTYMHDPVLIEHVSKLAKQSKRVCSVCSGALILAAAGILDGRCATTHWDTCELLASAFPNVQVEVDPIYIKDGDVWTSAGITAGTDMALAIIAEDVGKESALKLAQSLVTYMVRPGGQSQFSPALERQKLDKAEKFEDLHQWISDHLENDLSVDRLAEHENMSIRNFHRLYSQTMGMTPAKGVEAIRIESARQLLENTGTGIKTIAYQCGFGDEERMRRAFLRTIGIAPTEYRQRFQFA